MNLSLIALTLASALAAGAGVPNRPVKQRAAAAPTGETIVRRALPAFNSSSETLQADFTTEGSDALVATTAYTFDNDLQGWTPDAATYVEWSIKKDNGQSKDFSAIDATSTGSLFVEGPYQTFKRETSSIVSPLIAVPANGTLSFYVGYSLNYDDTCRLSLTLTEEGSDEAVEIWNSKDGPGEKPWAWRYITVSIENYAGKNVTLTFTYGPGSSDIFNTGGYLGDFMIDALTISGRKAVGHIDVMTGEYITFTDITPGDITAWEWNFPGAVPSTSTDRKPTVYYTEDGTFDVSLTVCDASGTTSTKTRTGFVTVTGTAPVAKILPPATFRLSSNRKHLVAPMAPVTFRDASAGFPTEHTWAFTGVDADPDEITTSTESDPTVSYSYLHDHTVALISGNSHGSSYAECEVTAEYSGVVNNLLPDDRMSVFDMEDWGVFPGSNTRNITAYAEKFSAPSVPVRVNGAYVFFNEASAEELVDQISNIGVHLYTSKDGKPDQRLDSWWWMTYELDLPSAGQAVGTAFPFTDAPFVNDEFFIVVDGIPSFKEGTRVSFGMADFRGDGGTALMLKDGEWIEVADYFPAGANHTSFMIYPAIDHSVMSAIGEEKGYAEVSAAAGVYDFEIFSYLGYNTPESDAPWMRVVSEPNGMTVDTISVEYDQLPEGDIEREGHIRLSDGASEIMLTLKQNGLSGIEILNPEINDYPVEYYSLQGQKIIKPIPGEIVIRKSPSGTSKIRY